MISDINYPKKVLALAGVATLISSKCVKICVDFITPNTYCKGPAISTLIIVLDTKTVVIPDFTFEPDETALYPASYVVSLGKMYCFVLKPCCIETPSLEMKNY